MMCYPSQISFPSPCGVLGVKQVCFLLDLQLCFLLFPSPCGVLGVKHNNLSSDPVVSALVTKVSVPLRGVRRETAMAVVQQQ